jgi:hypothetical protein
MNKYHKIAVGAGIVLTLMGVMLGSMYVVGTDAGTNFTAGPKHTQEYHLADTSQAFQQLGGIPNNGSFGVPYAAKVSLHNYVRMYGHQPYTLPDDPYDL